MLIMKTEYLTYTDTAYPKQICVFCGEEAQKDESKLKPITTTHTGLCNVCGDIMELASPRDFGYPNFIRIT
jgi:hypothetical protein